MDRIATPGANTVTPRPKHEKEARSSYASEAPITITLGKSHDHQFSELLPAAQHSDTFMACSAAPASSCTCPPMPLKLQFTTVAPWFAAHSTPSIRSSS